MGPGGGTILNNASKAGKKRVAVHRQPFSSRQLSSASSTEEISQATSDLAKKFREAEQCNFIRRGLKFGPFTISDVQGDGNCLFRAVSFLVNGSEEGHADLRQKSTDWLISNQENIAHFLVNGDVSKCMF